jgi:hypothetical protein
MGKDKGSGCKLPMGEDCIRADNASERLLYTPAFVGWPSINVLPVPRPHLHGGMMSMTKMPALSPNFLSNINLQLEFLLQFLHRSEC